MRVLLGVTGGIAAYKVALVVRRLMEDGHCRAGDPHRGVAQLRGSRHVGGPHWPARDPRAPSPTSPAWSTCAWATGRRGARRPRHRRLSRADRRTASARDLLRQRPARDDRARRGRAGDAHGDVDQPRDPGERRDAARARRPRDRARRGPPDRGRIAGPDGFRNPTRSWRLSTRWPTGSDSARHRDRRWGDLDGVAIVITAGGTREPIDPVRFLGNRSSGHQGFALAEAARERGAAVTVVAANVALPLGEGIERDRRRDGGGTRRGGASAAAQTRDVVIMAAAVADFRPTTVARPQDQEDGRRRTDADARARPRTSSRRSSQARRAGQVVVGFAAETGDDDAHRARARARTRRAARAPTCSCATRWARRGFGDVPNSVTHARRRWRARWRAPRAPSSRVAHAILDAVGGPARSTLAHAGARRHHD